MDKWWENARFDDLEWNAVEGADDLLAMVGAVIDSVEVVSPHLVEDGGTIGAAILIHMRDKRDRRMSFEISGPDDGVCTAVTAIKANWD